MKRRARNHVLTGCAVVQTNATNIPVPLMNTGDDTQVLKKGTVIAIMKAASQIDSEYADYDKLGLGLSRKPKRNCETSPVEGLSILLHY